MTALTKADRKVLGLVFAAEICDASRFLRSRIAKRLEARGYLWSTEPLYYELTQAGRIAYCEGCGYGDGLGAVAAC